MNNYTFPKMSLMEILIFRPESLHESILFDAVEEYERTQSIVNGTYQKEGPFETLYGSRSEWTTCNLHRRKNDTIVETKEFNCAKTTPIT